jgi:hypothetical protein
MWARQGRQRPMIGYKLARMSCLLGLIIGTMPAGAVYNANISGVLTTLSAYADGDYIYIQLANQPSSHPSCNPAYFVIEETVPADRRKMMLARLMSAYVTKEAVNIGYDATGSCVHTFIRVHRVG